MINILIRWNKKLQWKFAESNLRGSNGRGANKAKNGKTNGFWRAFIWKICTNLAMATLVVKIRRFTYEGAGSGGGKKNVRAFVLYLLIRLSERVFQVSASISRACRNSSEWRCISSIFIRNEAYNSSAICDPDFRRSLSGSPGNMTCSAPPTRPAAVFNLLPPPRTSPPLKLWPFLSVLPLNNDFCFIASKNEDEYSFAQKQFVPDMI